MNSYVSLLVFIRAVINIVLWCSSLQFMSMPLSSKSFFNASLWLIRHDKLSTRAPFVIRYSINSSVS